MKCNLTDFGTGVFFMLRWPEKFKGGQVSDSLVSHIDLLPTIYDWLELEKPSTFQGKSLLPIIQSPSNEINDAVFSEVTYHAGDEPMRCVRTKNFLYIKRWDPRLRPVGVNIDVSYSKEYLVDQNSLRDDMKQKNYTISPGIHSSAKILRKTKNTLRI